MLVYKTQTDKNKGAAIKAYLSFMYTKGQTLAPTVDYAPVPKGLLKQAQQQIDQIVTPT